MFARSVRDLEEDEEDSKDDEVPSKGHPTYAVGECKYCDLPIVENIVHELVRRRRLVVL